MPTRATRKGCGGRILINRPCRPNRRSRLFNRKKLTQIIIRTCEEWGTDDVQAAIRDALTQGCDNEERKKREKREADKAKELQAAIDHALKRIAALLAALAALACVSEDQKEEMEGAEDDLNKSIGPVMNGAVFANGGGYGGGVGSADGGLTIDGLAAVIVAMCHQSGPDAVREAVYGAIAECNEEIFPDLCDKLRSIKIFFIDIIDDIKPLLRFSNQLLMLLINAGVISQDEWSRSLITINKLADGSWDNIFDAVAVALECSAMPPSVPFTLGEWF